MRHFRDLPIRRKLLLTTFSSTAAALGLASAGFLGWDVVQFRNDAEQDVRALARLVAETSSTAAQFRDARVATETLAVLALRPRVEMGCLYLTNGDLLAEYHRDPEGACPAAPPVAEFLPAETLLAWAGLDVSADVQAEGEAVGLLYIHRDFDDLHARVRVAGGIVVGLLALAIATAFVIAARMQRSIVQPLLHLTETARTVSSRSDYALRATPVSNDETGVVVRAFNDMLDRIADRTAELSRTNAELEREIVERRRVETERTEALDRERDANRLKDEFLATLSHELRTPLNAVLGWTRVLRTARVAPGTEARALESIERNARSQARLVEDLLEISRIVTGKLRLQVREIDLAAIVEAAVEIVQPAAAAKRLHVAVDIARRPAMTSGDPDRLQQVMWNLLSNAVKFTPAGGRVTVRLAHDGGYRLSVQDTGAGIDPPFVRFVFEPFRQADGTASREHGGLGLGLAIAKQLVELHGGTIDAHSRGRDQGSTFEVFLPSVLQAPVSSVVPTQTMAALPPAPANDSLLCGVYVLVVDDQEDARVLLKVALEQYGAEVKAVGSASEAFAEIARRPPDVLLSDIGMPHEDGYHLIARVRALPAAAGGTVPAVAITAYASAGDRLASATAGYQAHIAKPFEPAEVAELVARLGRATQTRS